MSIAQIRGKMKEAWTEYVARREQLVRILTEECGWERFENVSGYENGLIVSPEILSYPGWMEDVYYDDEYSYWETDEFFSNNEDPSGNNWSDHIIEL